YENPIITKSGEERYISWQNSRIERDGRFAGTLSFGMDITERKRTEQRLLLSDQILKNVAAVVLMADATGRVTYASPSALAIFGYAPDELMGDGWWNLMCPDPTERERERQFVLHSVESKFPVSSEPYERLLRHKHGEPRWIAWQDAVGPDGSIIGVGHDITRRKIAEEQLQKVMHAVEQSPSSVVITDAEGRIEYVNPKFTEVTGYSNEEVLGQNPRLLKSGEMTQEQYRALWETITGGEEWRGEFHNRRKDGELFWEMASISPVKDSRGEITHFVAIKEDITHRKNLELQLRQSQKMEAVGTLAGGIAHDFNNLLTAINGYSELVWDKLPDSDPLREIVAEIRKAGDRAAGLTRQLLAFSRKQVMRPIPFNINDVVRELEHLLRRVLGENIELITKLDPRLGKIKADPGQVEQVIVNLAVNARDAMPAGGRLVIETSNTTINRIMARKYPGMVSGGYALISMTDNGCGIIPEVQPHIFEPFFTTKEVGKGTGLGLSTAYGIIKQSGGYIYFSSFEGRGTTFRVYLPRIEPYEESSSP
ncbi:MAG: PAS domain S-box protein, partial [Acidobacteriota bacterium]